MKFYLLSEEKRNALLSASRNLDYVRGKLEEAKGPKHVITELNATAGAIFDAIHELPEDDRED